MSLIFTDMIPPPTLWLYSIASMVRVIPVPPFLPIDTHFFHIHNLHFSHYLQFYFIRFPPLIYHWYIWLFRFLLLPLFTLVIWYLVTINVLLSLIPSASQFPPLDIIFTMVIVIVFLSYLLLPLPLVLPPLILILCTNCWRV